MLAALYAYIPRISTACNLIAVPIVVCFGMLSEATGAVRDVHFSSYGSNALVLSKTIVRSPLYAGLQNIAMDTDGAYRGSSPPAEGREFKPGPGREFGLSRSRALTAIGKTLEAGRFSIASIAESLGYRPHYRDAGIWMERFADAAGRAFASRAVFAWGLSNLAIVYKAQGRSKEAISLLEHALAIAAGAAGPDSYRVGAIANRLALYYAGDGRVADAEAFFKLAINAFEKSGDPVSEAGALHNLAFFYGMERRYSEETEAALRSLSLLTGEPTQDQSRVFDALNALGGAYNAQGRYKDAELTLSRAFAIAHQTFKSSDPRLSQVTANLAVIYKAEARNSEAIVAFTLALEEAGMALGPRDIWVGMIANRLAVTYLELGKVAEAEPLFERAVAIGENNSDEKSLFLSAALFNLSAVYARQLRYKDAEALLNRALAIRLRAYGPTHPAVAEVQNAMQAVRSARQQQGERSPRMAGKTLPDPYRER